MSPIYAVSLFLRIFPFMNTNPMESRTLGNIDPPRGPVGSVVNFSASPFGTTHELIGLEPNADRVQRSREDNTREKPITYDQVITPAAECPVAKAWLLHARQKTQTPDNPNGLWWDSQTAAPEAPALRFRHGFRLAKITPITRANDPFWNMRAFDTALARHDGYKLSSFICAMNQLVLDDPTGITQAPASASGGDSPHAP